MTPRDLIDRLVVETGVPEGLAHRLLRGALDELCRNARCWREARSLRVPEGYQSGAGAEIELPETEDGARRIGIASLQWRGQRPWGSSLAPDVHTGVIVDRCGYVKEGDELSWEDELAPEGDDWSGIPERVLGVLAPAALALAKFRACEMPRRPWTDAGLAQTARRDYAQELSELLRREITGNSHGPLVAAVPEAFYDE